MSVEKATFWEGLGNFFTGNLDYQRQLDMLERSSAISAEQAKIQRDWTAHQSNTEIRRGVADAIDAGINPYVAYQGGGASTPTFSAPSAAASQPQKSGQGFGIIGSLLASVIAASISSAAKLAVTNKQIANQVDKMEKTFKLAEFKANSASDLVRLKASYKPNYTAYYRYDAKGNAYKAFTKYKGKI